MTDSIVPLNFIVLADEPLMLSVPPGASVHMSRAVLVGNENPTAVVKEMGEAMLLLAG
ncbi:hypothetical protein KIPB_000687, partial [Kipferlia bialata]|eukprot:g687.t1